MTNTVDFEVLKEKLEKLQGHLEALLNSANADLEIAAHLQGLLQKNRLPEVHGLTCLARYISAHGISSEGFDLIATKKGREVWMIFSWAETFGLSSILLQSMIHLETKALFETKSNLNTADVFNELSHSLATAKKAGRYRLMVAKFDTAHLKISGCAQGFAPFMLRKSEKNQFQPIALCQPDALVHKPTLLEPAHSSAPAAASDIYNFDFSIPTGSRLYFVSPGFSEAKTLDDYKKATGLFSNKALAPTSSLLDDLNQLLMNSEDFLKSQNKTSDLTAVAIEIDASKLHFA